MKIIAKFIGKNSLGYINGHIYEINIIKNSICASNGVVSCTYGSIESFLKNWEIIKK